MNAIHALREHRPAAVLTTVVTAVLVELGLRTVRLPSLARWMGAPLELRDRPEPVHAVAPLSEDEQRGVRTVRAVLRHRPFNDSCLRVALVCGQLLRARRPRLVLGVHRQDGQVTAHAWLEIDGVPLDPASRPFAPLRVLADS